MTICDTLRKTRNKVYIEHPDSGATAHYACSKTSSVLQEQERTDNNTLLTQVSCKYISNAFLSFTNMIPTTLFMILPGSTGVHDSASCNNMRYISAHARACACVCLYLCVYTILLR
ncbi:hypothetical protein BJV82DRAFT_617641 [Fennellomyces sp. T-0311]|nr:hypothetical protein BJV82DRAFT_617641 [Fennellomyces sp. T-0311]